MLSTVLNRADAIRAIPPLGLQVAPHSTDGYTEAWHRAAKNAGAMYIATGTLSEEEGMLSGSFEITNMIDRSVETFSVSARSVSELDGLLLDLANRVVQKLVPGASRIAPLSAAQRSVDSLALYEDALIALNDSRWVDACLRLERIVKEQPKFFEAWYHLTIASAWAAQPTESALRAANKALSLAHTERDRRFIEVLIRYIKREQRTASYHDGRHKEGLRLFNLALLLDPYSKIASVHPVEHAQAQGDFVKWQYFRTLRGKKSRPGLVDLKPTNRLRFALRHYEALAAQETGIDSIQALAILGRNKEADARVPTGETLKSQALLYALARAVEDGRKQDQEAYFKMVWRENSANADVAGNQLRVQFVIGVLVAAELREELQTFMGFWELPGARRVGSKESQLRAHAAIVLGDATMIRSEGFLSWREEEEATALRAELKGDHEEAARIWNVLLDDPGEYGDDMPRFALARNLFALGKSAELKAVCSDLVYPKFRVPAHPAHRMRCREWKALPGAIPAPTPLPATP
jgi:tetratricopeptide (TPR) repeat protein